MRTKSHHPWGVIAWIGLMLFATAGRAEEWGRFRGPNGSGVAAAEAMPSFDDELWSVAIPFGRSSPAVARDRIFLTAMAADRLVTLALTRDSGEILWWRSIDRDRVASLHPSTDSSTPSPVTDGENVYAFFQEAGLISYDGEGRERWRKPLGPFRNFYGMAASPILAGDLVIVLCDQGGGSFLLAVDRRNGDEVWRQSRADRRESYGTPVLYPNASEPRMILVYGSKYLDAYARQRRHKSNADVRIGIIRSISMKSATAETSSISMATDKTRYVRGEMIKLMMWAQHIVTLRGDAAAFAADVALVFKLHLVLGMTIFLVFPFSRLVHVWSGFATLSYVTRAYQVVRHR